MEYILKPVRSALQLMGIMKTIGSEESTMDSSEECFEAIQSDAMDVEDIGVSTQKNSEDNGDDCSNYSDTRSCTSTMSGVSDVSSVTSTKPKTNNSKVSAKSKSKRRMKKIRHVDCIDGIGKSTRSKFELAGIKSMRSLKNKRKVMTKAQLKRLMLKQVGLTKRSSDLISDYLVNN